MRCNLEWREWNSIDLEVVSDVAGLGGSGDGGGGVVGDGLRGGCSHLDDLDGGGAGDGVAVGGGGGGGGLLLRESVAEIAN